MKAVSLAALVAFATLASAAQAEDTVRACIGASTNGQTLRKQGKLLAARGEMIACARDACPPIVRAQCARWLSEVDAAIPSVVVRAQDATGADVIGARLSIDGLPAKLDGQPVRLDPGDHTVAVENDSGARKQERVLLVEGETSRLVTLRFSPAAITNAPAESHDSVTRTHVPLGAWILGGLGVVALGGATYFGLAANHSLSDLDASCSPHCTDAQTQPGRTDALLFHVMLGAGAAAVAGAVVWAVAFPSSTHASASAARLELRPVLGGAVTAVTFAY